MSLVPNITEKRLKVYGHVKPCLEIFQVFQTSVQENNGKDSNGVWCRDMGNNERPIKKPGGEGDDDDAMDVWSHV